MPSEVSICNLALAHLGDTANITSIDPPEGSAQAAHCAQFYPIARDALLELHDWNFSLRRASLVLLSETINPWAYVYAVPNLMVKAIAVMASDADDDNTAPSYSDDYEESVLETVATVVPQPFIMETLSSGNTVICTNQEDAVLRYTVNVVNPAIFSPLFVTALSWMLASMLAGPLIKGETGRQEARNCLQMVNTFLAEAKRSDSNQRRVAVTHSVPWLSGR